MSANELQQEWLRKNKVTICNPYEPVYTVSTNMLGNINYKALHSVQKCFTSSTKEGTL